jgi:hypothetical protein
MLYFGIKEKNNPATSSSPPSNTSATCSPGANATPAIPSLPANTASNSRNLLQIVKSGTPSTRAAYEMSLGTVGILIGFSGFLRSGLGGKVSLTTGIATTFYASLLIAGILLLSKMKRLGKYLSIILHALQIPMFIFGIQYILNVGPYLTLYMWCAPDGGGAHPLLPIPAR